MAPKAQGIPPAPGGLKILGMKATNFMRLRQIEIHPGGKSTVLSGRNKQGKTSTIRALEAAFRTQLAPEHPVNFEEIEALVTVDLGAITVTRRWVKRPDAPGTYNMHLEIRGADGAKYGQTELTAFLGAISFDPLAFLDLPQEKQTAALLGLVDLGLDLGEWERERKRLYDQRTDANRDVTKAKGAFDAAEPQRGGVPSKEQSVAEVFDALSAAEHEHRVASALFFEIDERKHRVVAIANEVLALEAEAKGLIEWIANNPPVDPATLPDLDAIRKQAADLEATNKIVRQNAAYKERKTDYESALEIHKSLDKALKEHDGLREAAIKGAQWPVDGLGLSDEGVTLNNVPLKDLTGSSRLDVAFGISMALQPQARFILTQALNNLDWEGREHLAALAERHDFQIIAEEPILKRGEQPAGMPGAHVVVFEDGLVLSESEVPAAEPVAGVRAAYKTRTAPGQILDAGA